MIRELVSDPAVLSMPCAPATADDEALANDLVDTLLSLDDAAALAANQIGQLKCVVAFLDDDDKPRVMYNPVLRQAMGPYKAEEACLSLEAESKVTRFERIQVVYDEVYNGELTQRKERFNGFTAQAIQHMIDHCKGKLV